MRRISEAIRAAWFALRGVWTVLCWAAEELREHKRWRRQGWDGLSDSGEKLA